MSEVRSELLLPIPKDQQERDLFDAINAWARQVADAVNDNIILPDDGAYYFGGREVNGSWRVIRDGDNLVRQRLETGTWVTKGTDTP